MTPDQPRDCFHLGAAALSTHSFDQAESWARRGLAVDENDGHLWQLLGVALSMRSQVRPACEALETASVLSPLCPLAACTLAKCYLQLGHLDLARTCLLHLAGPGRCPLPLLPRVAAGLGAVGEDAVALEVCRQIISESPEHHAAHFGVAYYLGRLGGAVEEVIASLRRASALSPGMTSYRLNLAWVLACAGHTGEASALLGVIDPAEVSCPFWLSRMADIFAAAGNRERAGDCRQLLAVMVSFA